VNGLDLDPPVALLESVPDDARIITVADYEFVAVFHVGIFKGDFADSTLEDVSVSSFAIMEALLCSFLVRLQLEGVELV
jgi:hypothetical protein